MRLPKSWYISTSIGISTIIAVWLLAFFVNAEWFSHTSIYPITLIIIGIPLALVNLGWSFMQLRTALGYHCIPRIMSILAASLLSVYLLFASYNLLSQLPGHVTNSLIPIWLLPSALLISLVANLLEWGWGKTDLRAWLRVIGAALVGSIVLAGILIAWSIYPR